MKSLGPVISTALAAYIAQANSQAAVLISETHTTSNGASMGISTATHVRIDT